MQTETKKLNLGPQEIKTLTNQLQDTSTRQWKAWKEVGVTNKNLDSKLRRRRHTICKKSNEEADESVDLKKRIQTEELRTKTSERAYTAGLRICVMELAGLGVATGKIGQVMEAAGALCGENFESLPSRTACQGILDEGQVMAKIFLSQIVRR